MSWDPKLVKFSLPCSNNEPKAPLYVGHQVQAQLIITGFQLANFPQVGAQVLASAPSQTSRTIVAPTKYHSSPPHIQWKLITTGCCKWSTKTWHDLEMHFNISPIQSSLAVFYFQLNYESDMRLCFTYIPFAMNTGDLWNSFMHKESLFY